MPSANAAAARSTSGNPSSNVTMRCSPAAAPVKYLGVAYLLYMAWIRRAFAGSFVALSAALAVADR
jgi:hypothetical protein